MLSPPDHRPGRRAAVGGAGADVRRDVERHLVGLWNELRVLAEAARRELGVDPVLLHFAVLSDDEQPQRPGRGRECSPSG